MIDVSREGACLDGADIGPVTLLPMVSPPLHAESLARILAAHLDQDKETLIRLWRVNADAIQEIIAIATSNRLENWLLSAASTAQYDLPCESRRTLEHSQNGIVGSNAFGLRTAQRVSRALLAEGIEACFFKGALWQYRLHGTYFLRRTTDVDILIAPSNLEVTHRVLAGMGYAIAPECQSLWWRIFLREQHFFCSGGGMSVVDLHTSVQQPGGPQPRRPSRLLATEMQTVGGDQIPVPQLEHSLLISAISLYKGIQHREPVAAHLLDIAVALRNFPNDVWLRVHRVAAEQGLTRLLQFAINAATELFGPEASASPAVGPENLALSAAVFGLPTAKADRISRTWLHWTVSESLPRFIGQAAWERTSAGARLIFNHPDLRATSALKPTGKPDDLMR